MPAGLKYPFYGIFLASVHWKTASWSGGNYSASHLSDSIIVTVVYLLIQKIYNIISS